MTAWFAFMFVLIGVAATALSFHIVVETLKGELNASRASEQLLLNRLASRTLAEFSANTYPITPEPEKTFISSPSGLVMFEQE